VTTILICDDQPQVRAALCARLAALPAVDQVVTCASGEELLDGYERIQPELVLLDTQMPGLTGADAIRRLLHRHPDAHVLMLTSRADRDNTAAAVAAGARGYVAKEGSSAGFASAVAGALVGRDLGEPIPPPQVPAARAPEPSELVRLTERELQVLHGMAQGRSNAEIGRTLYLSEDTIKTHARRLFRKLGVHDRAKAVAHGFRQGLVT
jgi:DNA-binding NarL/FixJ family response regulator